MNDKVQGLCGREKLWNERNVDEKLNKLREVIINLSYQVQDMQLLLVDLKNHSHLDGKIVAPIVKDFLYQNPRRSSVLE